MGEESVKKEEFGSHIAEYEGFRDVMMDELIKLREEIENMREDIKELKKSIDNTQEK